VPALRILKRGKQTANRKYSTNSCLPASQVSLPTPEVTKVTLDSHDVVSGRPPEKSVQRGQSVPSVVPRPTAQQIRAEKGMTLDHAAFSVSGAYFYPHGKTSVNHELPQFSNGPRRIVISSPLVTSSGAGKPTTNKVDGSSGLNAPVRPAPLAKRNGQPSGLPRPVSGKLTIAAHRTTRSHSVIANSRVVRGQASVGNGIHRRVG